MEQLKVNNIKHGNKFKVTKLNVAKDTTIKPENLNEIVKEDKTEIKKIETEESNINKDYVDEFTHLEWLKSIAEETIALRTRLIELERKQVTLQQIENLMLTSDERVKKMLLIHPKIINLNEQQRLKLSKIMDALFED